MIRRSGLSGNDYKLTINDDVSICTQKLIGTSYNKEMRYTRREVTILTYLNQQKKPVSRDELLRKVWGYKSTEQIDTRTVDIHIAKIRKKIEIVPKFPEHLVTLRGEGYQLFCCQS